MGPLLLLKVLEEGVPPDDPVATHLGTGDLLTAEDGAGPVAGDVEGLSEVGYTKEGREFGHVLLYPRHFGSRLVSGWSPLWSPLTRTNPLGRVILDDLKSI